MSDNFATSLVILHLLHLRALTHNPLTFIIEFYGSLTGGKRLSEFAKFFLAAKGVWKKCVIFLRIHCIYLRPMFFSYHPLVRSYFHSFLCSDSNRIKLHFALFHPLV